MHMQKSVRDTCNCSLPCLHQSSFFNALAACHTLLCTTAKKDFEGTGHPWIILYLVEDVYSVQCSAYIESELVRPTRRAGIRPLFCYICLCFGQSGSQGLL